MSSVSTRSAHLCVMTACNELAQAIRRAPYRKCLAAHRDLATQQCRVQCRRVFGRNDAVTANAPTDRVPLDAVRPLLLLGGAVLIGFVTRDRGQHMSNASAVMLLLAVL